MARSKFDRYVMDSICLGRRSSKSGQMMNLALTYDHRMLDGREAVIFLVKVCS